MADVMKVREPRHHEIKNSWGVKDAFHYYRKIRPQDSVFVLTECEYLKIIRTVNNIIRELLQKGNEIVLPEKMGKLEIRKSIPYIRYSNGKLKTNLPIDWDSTLKLWYEDEEAYNNKRFVRQEVSEVFKVFYNKHNANYNNKSFYQFRTNRELKKGLKKNIKEDNLDALLIYKDNGKDH